jgi:hypothetical protein
MKHRVHIEGNFDYDVDPSHYPGCNTPEERAAVDEEAFDEDPSSMLDGIDWAGIKITVSPIDD